MLQCTSNLILHKVVHNLVWKFCCWKAVKRLITHPCVSSQTGLCIWNYPVGNLIWAHSNTLPETARSYPRDCCMKTLELLLPSLDEVLQLQSIISYPYSHNLNNWSGFIGFGWVAKNSDHLLKFKARLLNDGGLQKSSLCLTKRSQQKIQHGDSCFFIQQILQAARALSSLVLFYTLG